MEVQILTQQEYEQYEQELNVHPLQSFFWGELKSETWEVLRYGFFENNQCLSVVTILIKKLSFLPLKFAYIPRGISYKETCSLQDILEVLIRTLKKTNLFFLAIDPDVPFEKDWQKFRENCQKVQTILENLNFIQTKGEVQTTRTVVINLQRPEAEIFADIKPEYRRCIRKAQKNGVQIIQGTDKDLAKFYKVYKQIAQTKGFGIHPFKYYQKIYENLIKQNRVFLLLAKIVTKNCLNIENQSESIDQNIENVGEQAKIIGGYLVFCNQNTAFEMYGGCLEEAKTLKANHLLKWSSFMLAKSLGKTFYDQWGAELFMPGIKEFKESFGGQVAQLPKQYGLSLKPCGLQIYKFLIWLNFKRQKV